MTINMFLLYLIIITPRIDNDLLLLIGSSSSSSGSSSSSSCSSCSCCFCNISVQTEAN